MTIAKYQELSGLTVPSSKNAFYLAKIKRTQGILEDILGYTLDKTKSSDNYYEELGKSASDFTYPTNDDTLLDADEVVGAYRLYHYDPRDKYLVVDPFSKLHAVKLVYVRQGDEPNGITLKTFEADEVRVQVGRNGISKYIEKAHECWYTTCNCDDRENVQLAVDADWLYDGCLPSELQYIWADMVTYYANPKNELKSETLGSHSYTRFGESKPEEKTANISILKRYAGPYGALSRPITI